MRRFTPTIKLRLLCAFRAPTALLVVTAAIALIIGRATIASSRPSCPPVERPLLLVAAGRLALSVAGYRRGCKVARGGLDRHRRKFEGLALTLDLSNRSWSPRKDEFGAGAMLFDRFITRLEEIVCLARDSAESISGATTEIAVGNADLSARTGLQAASLQQTAANLEELRAAVRQDSESGDRANRLSTDAAGMVEDVHHAIQRLNATIDRMSADTALNSDITSLTERIAFQTHILALNVAVDPARAGEIGRDSPWWLAKFKIRTDAAQMRLARSRI